MDGDNEIEPGPGRQEWWPRQWLLLEPWSDCTKQSAHLTCVYLENWGSVFPPETWVSAYKTAWCHSPEDHNLNSCCHENLKTLTLTYVCIVNSNSVRSGSGNCNLSVSYIVWSWNAHIRCYMFWILLSYYVARSLMSLVFLNWICCHWALAEQLTFQLNIQEVVSSNLCLETGCLDWSFYGFPLSLQANAGIVRPVNPRQFPSTSWLNHNSLIIVIIWHYIMWAVGSVIK
jgi:hypothetical protein